MSYITVPNFSWKDPVATAGDLPADSNTNGDVRVTLDTDIMYLWNGSAWISVASPGGAPTAITALTGGVTATGPGAVAATVVSVGGSTASAIHNATVAANAATNANTASTIVKRDASGNFSASTITADLTGTATNFSGSLAGDVTGTQSATTVALVGGSTASDVNTATIAANAATNVNTPSTIVERDGSGNFSAGTITATLNGAATSATDFTGSLTGDVTGTQTTTTLKVIPHKVYVDFVSGNDSNTGTIVQPWKTIQHAYNSISPTLNEPYVIYISGGNNDLDTPITAKPNVSLEADYPIQISASFTVSGGATNDLCSFTNITFDGAFSWVRSDATNITANFYNCLFFSGPTVQQNGAGVGSVQAFNCTFVNSSWNNANGGYGVFVSCNFLGSTTFADPGPGGFSYLQFDGGYSSGAMTINGPQSPVYFTGFVHDVAFGASLTFVTTGNGTASVETDSNGLPPTYTGTPSSITYLSQSQSINSTKGYAIGDVGSPTETNVLLSIKDGHIKSKQTTPPTTTTNPNAGTAASSSVSNATDTAGNLTLTTGTDTWSSGIQCTVNFNTAYNVAPLVLLTSTNGDTAANNLGIFVSSTTAGFSINFASASQEPITYAWTYMVIETY